jgi:hypothetical protein
VQRNHLVSDKLAAVGNAGWCVCCLGQLLMLCMNHKLVGVGYAAWVFVALGQLLGFARATSDGVFSATIW